MNTTAVKPKKQINNYEVYPKAGVAKTIMYQNMSSHYRRVYNAKPRVDTGPPFSHKPKPNLPPKPLSWSKHHSGSLATKQSLRLSLSSTNCSRKGCSETEISSFQPQISKFDTESKLRSMRVYHPPRKRIILKSLSSSSIIQMSSNPELTVPEIPWIHPEALKSSPCKGNSSDSAYTEEGDGGWSGGDSRGPTPVSDTPRVINSSDNLMYVKFVRGITEEVLKKGLYTNKALKEIFQKHIDSHKQFLNLRRMQEEVRKLQEELGILGNNTLDIDGRKFNLCLDFSIGDIERIQSSSDEDQELLDALSQLNISPSLKADIASSLGLQRKLTPCSSTSSLKSIKNCHTVKNTHGNNKRATFSSPLEVIFDANQCKANNYDHNQKLPQSDDDSYEMLSECSESRPITPLGLAW